MSTIWETLRHTPWWAYLLFFYLLKRGYDATKTRVFAFKKLFILPSLFLAISINTLLTSFRLTPLTTTTYLITFILGTVGGWLLVRNVDLQFDHKQHLVKLPGTWTTLILISVIFSTKYYFGYSLTINPTLAQDTHFELMMLSVSGFCTGLFLGRLAGYLIRRKNASHCDLST